MTQPYPEAPTPDCISCSEADDSYSLELLKRHAQATHDRGYSVGWDAGFAHGRAQARAEFRAELKPVAVLAQGGTLYLTACQDADVIRSRGSKPLAIIPDTKE